MVAEQAKWCSSLLAKIGWLALACSLLAAGAAQAAGPMLPQVYNDQSDIGGWLMSEKLDGIRGYWDGKQLLSKNGKILQPPPAFVEQLPPFALEGELWGGRGTFEQTAATVLHANADQGWLNLKFAIFDLPQTAGTFSARLDKGKAWFAAHPSQYAFLIPQRQLRDRAELRQELQRIERLGGEGLIVRQPDALYTSGRSPLILKVKNYQDAEARVVAHLPGKGRNRGRLGALRVQLDDGTLFSLGSGFSDAERESPPPIGARVTFKFYGKYRSGIPKFSSFMRIRRDGEL